MSKKLLMYGMLLANIILFLAHGILCFLNYNINQIYKEKNSITLYQPEDMSREEYVDLLIEVSEKLSIDILYERVDKNFNWEFYKTNISENFFDIFVEGDTILLEENDLLSTNNGERARKIYGFGMSGDEITIKNISEITNFDLSAGKFLICTKDFEQFAGELQKNHIEVGTEGGDIAEDDYKYIRFLIVTFLFFLCISIVFYAFSRAKEFAVKKSMGYSSMLICVLEIKNNFVIFLGELLGICILVLLIFSILYDFISAMCFLKVMAWQLALLLLFLLLIFSVSIWYVSMRCTVQHMKGKSKNKELFFVTTLFKSVIFVVLVLILSETSVYVKQTYDVYRMTIQTMDKIKNFSATTMNGLIENPDDDLLKYDKPFYDFYQMLHDNQYCIIADTNSAKWQEDESKSKYYPINVNDNYIDFNERIYDVEGNRITSDVLKDDMLNIFIPQGYDYSEELERISRIYEIKEEQVNLIEYSSESEFFSFDNENHAETGGYFKNAIAVVFDEDVIGDPEFRSMAMESFLSSSMYFKSNSEETAYEEIYPYIEQSGLSNIILSTPSVRDTFKENLKYRKHQLYGYAAQLSIYIFAFVVMMIYSAELFFANNAKEIANKMINGYSFIEIFQTRLAGKTLMLVILSALSFVTTVSIGIAVVSVGVELMLFCLIVKRQCSKNFVLVVKGE